MSELSLKKLYQACLLPILFLAGCTPPLQPTLVSSISTPIVQPSTTPTPIPGPSTTSSPSTIPTSQPTLTPTRGADLSFLYLGMDGIFRYSLSTWSAERIDIPADGLIQYAVLSPDQTWLAYVDAEGLKLIQKPYTDNPYLVEPSSPDEKSFNPKISDKYLAYTDNVGLKILNLGNRILFTLIKHDIILADTDDNIYYFPEEWSPGGDWLWIYVQFYEDSSRLLAYVPTKKISEFTACNGYIEWSRNNQSMFTSVTSSGYSGCGCPDGIFKVNFRKDQKVHQTSISEGENTCDADLRAFNKLSMSPDGTQLVYIFVPDLGQTGNTYHLMLMNSDGTKLTELVSSSIEIWDVVWSSDGKYIVYTQNDQFTNKLMRYDPKTGVHREIFSSSEFFEITRPLMNEEWIVINEQLQTQSDTTVLFLVNIRTGDAIKVADVNYIFNFNPILGIED
jgi:hypothetical protein